MAIHNNGILDIIDEYVKFSKTIQENDENIRKISNHIKNTDLKYIKLYYSIFFGKFFRSKNLYQNISPFFRILTINKIRSSDNDKNEFNSLDEFNNYVEVFKEKLLSEEFPDNFKEDIEKINEIDSYDYDGKTYHFNFDFIKEFTEIKPKSIKNQLKNYANFRFFRHFILYYSDESFELRGKYKDLWESIYNYLIKTLQIDKEDFFIDYGAYFKKRGRFETEDTWGALVKKEIAGFLIEEERKEALQLFININPKGLRFGTYLGANTNEQIAGFIKKQVNLKREDIIGEFKKLKRKYPQNIQIEYEIKKKDIEYVFNEDLNDEIIQDKILNLFKASLSIVYKDFQGGLKEFSSILKDIFKIYYLLVEKLEHEPNLERYLSYDDLFLDFKDQIVEELKQKEFVGIDLDKIVSKVLAILDTKKNVILIGAPGTGKTQILETIFQVLSNNLDFIDDFSFTTASSDWSIFETIGGLIPFGEGNLKFLPGLFLKCFSEEGEIRNRWLIVDELNRANIDKAFGYFFSLLSDQEVELPFQTYGGDTVKIIPLTKWLNEGLTNTQIIEKIMGDSIFKRFFMTPNWRMGGTINSSDKASLHQLSHAFIRRFGFVNIPLPDINKFMKKFSFEYLEEDKKNQLEFVWRNVNKVYEIGPAIIIDMYKLMKNPNINILDAFEAYIMPQIDYLPDKVINDLLKDIISEFKEEDEKILEGFRVLKIKEQF